MDKKGQYSIKASSRLLEGGISNPLLTDIIWNNCVLPPTPKVSLFTWEIWINWKKMGFQLASRCPLCQESEESLDHLLIHCPVVWGHWVVLISLPRMVWAWNGQPFLFKRKQRKFGMQTPPPPPPPPLTKLFLKMRVSHLVDSNSLSLIPSMLGRPNLQGGSLYCKASFVYSLGSWLGVYLFFFCFSC